MYISTFPLKVAWAPSLGYAVDALVVEVLWSIHRLYHDSPQYVVQVPYHLFRTLLRVVGYRNLTSRDSRKE